MRPKQPKSPEEILQKAIPLFANAGFSGVSMRQIAKQVNISAAALYHHFPDKETLYLSAVDLVFKEKAQHLLLALHASGTLETRLYGVILQFIRVVGMDHTFRAVMQREMLEGEPERLRIMADRMFKQSFGEMRALAAEIAPGGDATLLAGTLVSLVAYHFQTRALRPYLPGYQPCHESPEHLARFYTQLILEGGRRLPRLDGASA
ncbi:transcriptional regulator, TetR family [Magnetococcus marinus MC-1]|uniref:Transcriptional regulator, TetR family n=1 Tax=Magnetococcus marinus (strain ATCC BAA-1437 / JCM 17883 / MC-1) TaxID=156889 RepID=A0LCF7_MAGMM|nr:TetR/AcrR family transcriptional regulator [Magnetococcus marinus]ABK45650.1 transcriptional regulator, TetR family [Magnetococcus marinus MC-1]